MLQLSKTVCNPHGRFRMNRNSRTCYSLRPCFICIFLVGALFPLWLSESASATLNQREHLTEREVDLIRDNQELDRRTEVFIKAAERRLMVLTNPGAAESKQAKKEAKEMGELPAGNRADLLSDIAQILDEASTNIDDVGARKSGGADARKALRILSGAANRFLPALTSMRGAAEGAEREALEQAIENCQTIIEASTRVAGEHK